MEKFVKILVTVATLLLIILAAINVSYAAIFFLALFVAIASVFFAWGKESFINWTIYGSIATTFVVFFACTITSLLGIVAGIGLIVSAIGGAFSPCITACAYIELKQ